ncbi:MAG TPA: protoporphyrinogen oxidase [Acidimicrobiales bacterium]|nr:protoporphyrinogen oxidase [Acidimicrobiales bacterium]
MRVAVVGGGIAGLAAAWEALAQWPDAQVTIHEPGRLGGKIRTTPFAGHPVDEGPDAFLTRVPDAIALCAQLGLDADLVAPAAGSSMLWWAGRLRPLPDGLVLGVPRRLGPVLRSGLLSWRGAIRAAGDLVLPRTPMPAGGDVSVRALVASRFGVEVADRLVDPLVGGIHAGRTDQLSASATVPQLVAAAGRSRSLLRGLAAAPGSADGPVFLTPAGGMGVLVDTLVGALTARGVSVATDRVRSVEPAGAGRLVVAGEVVDACVLAVPAGEAAALVAGASPDAAAGLRQVGYAGVVLTTMAFPADAAHLPPGVNGFLVPRSEGRLMTACSFASSKWPHWADPGTALVRASAGRHLDSRALDLDDDRLVDALVDELSAALGRRLPAPSGARVSRWPAAFPQYTVGHLRRLAGIEAALGRDLPAVALAGAGTRGSGIPACIASGRGAAHRLLAAAPTA